MIETEHQRAAAISWVAYWRRPDGGQQSWLGQEEVREELMQLRRSIDEYDRKVRRDEGDSRA